MHKKMRNKRLVYTMHEELHTYMRMISLLHQDTPGFTGRNLPGKILEAL